MISSFSALSISVFAWAIKTWPNSTLGKIFFCLESGFMNEIARESKVMAELLDKNVADRTHTLH